MRFKGSQSYVSTEDLTLAVNAAIALRGQILDTGLVKAQPIGQHIVKVLAVERRASLRPSGRS